MPGDRIELETDVLPLLVLVPVGVASLATSSARVSPSNPSSYWASPIVWALFRQMVIVYEEPLVRRRFEDPFEEDCQRVPRWIPPFG